jgi:hypothetical protein
MIGLAGNCMHLFMFHAGILATQLSRRKVPRYSSPQGNVSKTAVCRETHYYKSTERFSIVLLSQIIVDLLLNNSFKFSCICNHDQNVDTIVGRAGNANLPPDRPCTVPSQWGGNAIDTSCNGQALRTTVWMVTTYAHQSINKLCCMISIRLVMRAPWLLAAMWAPRNPPAC